MISATILKDSAKALLVSTFILFLYGLFWLFELWLWVPLQFLEVFSHRTNNDPSQSPQKPTVVIVGANFSGLSALRHLLRKPHLFRIILVDQRDYFEYTPGILRLFCEPDHFNNITKKLPTGDSYRFHEFIQGKVISIVGGEPESTRTQKILTYQSVKRDRQGATFLASTTTKNELPYDYLILATGATYPAPIWPMKNEWSLEERYRGWKKVHQDLSDSHKIIVLGAGAVGVELAAEIVDHYGTTKEVTLLDGERLILPLFPKPVGKYAYEWLEQRGVKFLLGQKLLSWNESSCLFHDGTVLQADVVYNCFGSRPNSEFFEASTGSLPNQVKDMTLLPASGRTIAVDNTLQVQGGPISDGSIFACGDVASPPTSHEKQAFQAELQGKIAAQNVMVLASSGTSKLRQYPQDIMMDGSDELPLVIDLSLGRSDGVIAFNGLCTPGPFAAVVKWILEYTKVMEMQGRPLGELIWKIADFVTLFLSVTLLKSRHDKSE